MTRRLLIVANPCPPSGSNGASMRVRKWCEHLPAFGWQPVVITGPFQDPARCAPLTDVEILGASPSPSVPTTQRAGTVEPLGLGPWLARRWIVPDSYVLRWLPRIGSLLDTVRQAGPFDAIVSSSPLDTCHLVARRLQRDLQIPWIADFRDPWIGNPFTAPRPWLAEAVNRWHERRVVSRADRVTCASPVHLSEMRHRYPRQADHFGYLPNGYDGRAMPAPRPARPAGGLMTLIHAGTLYGARTPATVLDAMAELPSSVQLHFIGGASPVLEQDIQRRRLSDQVTVTPPLAHDQALALMSAADALVVIPGAAYAIPGKIYEYLATGRPIIHVGPRDSAVAHLLADLRVGRTVQDTAGVLDAVRSLLVDRSAIPSGSPPGLERYDRRTLAGDFAALLDHLVKG